MRRWSAVLAGLVAFLAVGCASFYPEPDLTAAEVATIEGEGVIMLARVVLASIDGQLPPLSNKAKLRPGPHKVSATYATLTSQGAAIVLTFDAEAAHRYIFKGRTLGGRWQGWILDDTTGRVVAGRAD
jgi:hypothetical protein